MLRLGRGSGFDIALSLILGIWIVSAVGLMFEKKWAWFASTSCVLALWLILLVVTAKALVAEPRHGDYARDLTILILLFLLPVTVGLYGLWRIRGSCGVSIGVRKKAEEV